MTDRALELADIQGNVLGGFNTEIQVFLAFTALSSEVVMKAAQWVAGLADSVTTAADVSAQRGLMRQANPDSQLTWLCVAVGQQLLKATQPDLYIRDDAFNGGMLARAPSILNDRTDPATWKVGSVDKPVDVLLIVASNVEAAAVQRANDLLAVAAAAGLALSYRETGRRLHNEQEHFGFRDGISQPLVLGFDEGGTFGAGNFVFGYPVVAGGPPVVPYSDERGVADNGSLLVFRRLEQDVAEFDRFCDQEAARLAPNWPQLSAPHLKALVVGRWPSGALASVQEMQDPGATLPQNDFDFSDDASGVKCPTGAHIRKVNPRQGQRDRVDVPRILRRGIPFGRPIKYEPDGARGLNFIAFQTSIRGQFEFLTQHWMNSDQKPAPGHDLLVGRSGGSRSMTISGPLGPVAVSTGPHQWIVPTGGAYLLAPSRSGLRKLGTPSASLGLWKVKVFSARVIDGARGLLSSNLGQ